MFRGAGEVISTIKLDIFKGLELFQTLYPEVQPHGDWAVLTTKKVTPGEYTVKATEIIGDVHQSVAERLFTVI